MRTVEPGQRYRHFKGNEYEILHVATHSETLEAYVVYRALYGEFGVWVRPLDMFLSNKEVEGVEVERFSLIR